MHGQNCNTCSGAQPVQVCDMAVTLASAYRGLPFSSLIAFNTVCMQGTADVLSVKPGNQCALLLLAWPPWPLLLLLLLLLPAAQTQTIKLVG